MMFSSTDSEEIVPIGGHSSEPEQPDSGADSNTQQDHVSSATTQKLEYPNIPLKFVTQLPAWQERVQSVLLEREGLSSKEILVAKHWLSQQLPFHLRHYVGKKEVSANIQQMLELIHRSSLECPVCHEPRAHYRSSPLPCALSAAEYGCARCYLLMAVLRVLKSEFLRSQNSEALKDSHCKLPTFNRTSNYHTIEVHAKARWGLARETYCIRFTSSCKPLAISRHFSPINLWLLDTCSKWLQTCVSGHSLCTTPNTGFLPRRLICVGDLGCTPYLTESPRGDCTYAALSYCWGMVKNTLVTTRSNVHKHYEAIRLAAMPKTIQDAVITCQYLKIPYLWVDALCIVQGDLHEKGWYEQSLQMGSVYYDAHLVIAASAAAACNEGFFREETRWKSISESVEGSTAPRVHVAKLGRCEGSIQLSKLDQRGWTMQECILPRRVFHIGKYEAIWECTSDCQCQCDRVIAHDLWKHTNVNVRKHFDPAARRNMTVAEYDEEGDLETTHIGDFLSEPTPETTYWTWERLVERYSRRSLTVSDDKLPAISGLARFFHMTLNIPACDYLAGLWRPYLVEGLLWHVTGSKSLPRPTKWQAPSWSWASMDEDIGYFQESYQFMFEPDIQINACQCTPSSIDEFGRVRGGFIRLRGALTQVSLSVKLLDETTPYKGSYTGRNGNPGRAHANLLAEVQLPSLSVLDPDQSLEVLLDEQLAPGHYKESYYCLYIGCTYHRAHPGVRFSWLLLRKCAVPAWEHTGLDTFTRFGIGMHNAWRPEHYLRSPDFANLKQAEIVLL
ncbi:heterokaryon incompatibility protein-domain-containing protein [Paraphoma chrysanthemicola]|uniref:Heterokaryon incompatibility protein-domain-containing protein n=1 Tax=Paraphoma chrysanthemicola TaxID=798071 RepID=A0A8K0R334_9PLEO|nr:heterokaryon incompatibility protein-domain-containing protein [Paraphoma chrysanthemicola]